MKLYWLGLVITVFTMVSCSNQLPAEESLEDQARAGAKEIIAHAGDRAAMPSGWKESEWENSVQAIRSAIAKNPRWIEIDIFLNRHPEAITTNTPHGIVYVHHDPKCERIDANGRGTGTWRNIEIDRPAQVDECAERLENILNLRDSSGRILINRWVIEMKSGKHNSDLPRALYHLLTRRGQRTTEIVSSINSDMLIALRNLASQQGIAMNLMRVLAWGHVPSNATMDWSKQQGFKYVAVEFGAYNGSVGDYAKDIGLRIGIWHWVDWSPKFANKMTNKWDMDFMISDDITDLKTYPGWR